MDGVVEYGVCLLLLGDEGVLLVEKLDAGDDDTRQEGKLECAYDAAQEAVDPAEADGFE